MSTSKSESQRSEMMDGRCSSDAAAQDFPQVGASKRFAASIFFRGRTKRISRSNCLGDLGAPVGG